MRTPARLLLALALVGCTDDPTMETATAATADTSLDAPYARRSDARPREWGDEASLSNPDWRAVLLGIDDTDLHDVDFVDTTHGWVVGDEATLLRTTDGGVTWERLSGAELDAHFTSVDFVDRRVGWVAADSETIQRTMDSGETWEVVTLPEELYSRTSDSWGPAPTRTDVVDLQALDADRLYVALYGGILLLTTDGGATWETSAAGPLAAIAVVDDERLWGAWDFGGVQHTNDGGYSWSYDREHPTLSGIHFTSATDGWVVGSRWDHETWRASPYVSATTDGETFSEQDLPGVYESGVLYDIAFADADVGFAVGHAESRAFVIGTTDGGQTWTEHACNDDVQRGIPRLPLGALNAVSVVDSHHAWAVGSSGTLLRYAPQPMDGR